MITSYEDYEKARERLADLRADLADLDDLGLTGSETHQKLRLMINRLRCDLDRFELGVFYRIPRLSTDEKFKFVATADFYKEATGGGE